MNRLLQLLPSLMLVALLGGFPDEARADLYVTISAGGTTISPGCALAVCDRFNLSMNSPAGQPTTMPLLKCATPPCDPVYFPSGTAGGENTDTLVFRDASAAQAEVKKGGANTARLTFGGVEIEALQDRDTDLMFTFGTKQGDLLPGSNASPNYPLVVKFKGKFADSSDMHARRCEYPATRRGPWCARLELVASGLTFGQRTINERGLVATATSAAGCTLGSAGDNPCGPGGYWSQSGEFLVEEGESVTCNANCTPWLTATLWAKFGAKKEKLVLDKPFGLNVAGESYEAAESIAATTDGRAK